MAAESAFAPQWTKIIARAWVDPTFKSHLEAQPDQVLATYGITQVGGKNLSDLSGHISVVDATAASQKPHMDGDQLVIPLPQAPKDYDTVVDPNSVALSGAGSPGNAHPGWETVNGGVATVWTSGTPGVTGVETGQGPNDSKTPGGAPKTQSNSSHSVPSVPTLSPDSEDGDGGDADAGEAGDAGADAAEAGADVAAEGGADAAADAAAAAAALCA